MTEKAVLRSEIRKRVRRRVRHVALFLSVMGPGLITNTVDTDAGGIATYSVAGAHYGYSLLWVLVPVAVALVVIQEMCARMGAITRKGLADLIRESFGVRVAILLLLGLVFTNLANTMGEFAGVAASAEIFGIDRSIVVPASAILVWFLVVKGDYKSVERIFLFGCILYVSYLISAALARPNWHEVVEHTLRPTTEWDREAIYMVIGIVGTTIAPWMQFYHQSSVVDKGITERDYPFERIDVIIGGLVAVFVAGAILVACAATLFPHGIRIESGEDAARALEPLAGKYCSALFAAGLLNASLFAAAVLPLSTAYYVCEALGWEVGVDRKFKEAPYFFSLYTALIVLGAGLVLIPRIPLITVMIVSQVMNGILLPVVLIAMLLLVNQKRLMGKYTNSPGFNFIAWSTVIIVCALTFILAWLTIFR